VIHLNKPNLIIIAGPNGTGKSTDRAKLIVAREHNGPETILDPNLWNKYTPQTL
jgi:signal recognition particle GTPase